MAKNPWLVESLNSFLYLKCPECVFEIEYENEDKFQYHAVEKHPWSNVLFGDTDTVSPKANENEIFDSIKKENFDDFDDESYNDRVDASNSYSPPTTELKVEFWEEGEEENKDFVKEGRCKSKEKRPYHCSFCKASFSRKPNLKRHIATVHKEGNSEELLEEKRESTKKDKERSEPLRKNNRPFPCPDCPSSFTSRADLKIHTESVHEGLKPYQCSFCPSSFSRKNNWKRHEQGHGKHSLEKPSESHSITTEEKDGVKKETQLNQSESDKKDKRPFPCLDCPSSFSSNADLKIHTNTVHEGLKPFQCSFCGSNFSRKNNLKTHIEIVHEGKKPSQVTVKKDKKFLCPECPSRFSSNADLKIHTQSVHEGLKPFQCCFCGKTFSRKRNWNRHIESVHEGKGNKEHLKCTLCILEFSDLAAFKDHVVSVHDGQKPHLCSLCNKSYFLERSLRVHYDRIHDETKKHKKSEYLCKICNMIFDSKLKLGKHKVADHGEKKPYPCTACQEAYFVLANLKQHVASVHEGKRYDCTLCDSNFSSKFGLKQHMDQVHDQSRPWLCTICGSSSKTKQALGLHIAAIHEEKKPHMCSLCGSSFVARFALLSHVRIVHEKRRPFICPVESCEYTAATKSQFKMHLERHDGVKRCVCPLCDAKFYRKYDLKAHISTVHEGKKRVKKSHGQKKKYISSLT